MGPSGKGRRACLGAGEGDSAFLCLWKRRHKVAAALVILFRTFQRDAGVALSNRVILGHA